MKGSSALGLGLVAACCGQLAFGAERAATELDFFAELPEILSVSRLAQPLNETPGAVTVLDRELIRRAGARSVAELLRLVPGFIVSHFEGAARPIAHYHAEYDSIARHLQVFVDGRSIYSSMLVGSANLGMLGVLIEDIERIEVLRGSNSAAYGANAFQGVVNIVTRHAADTRGGMLSVAAGEGGVRDGTARIGWGDERAMFRVSAASREDRGFDGYPDSSRTQHLHFRGDLQPGGADDVHLAGGYSELGWEAFTSPRSQRTEHWRHAYARLQWTRRLNATDQFKLSGTFDEERFRDFYPLLRADGTGRRTELEGQHNAALGQTLRVVWGGQYRTESVDSPDLFPVRREERFDLVQAFGNLEWRPLRDWIVNAGGLVERHSISGVSRSPRLMVNYHLQPGHTLRLGRTYAHKQPTLFESRADWRLGSATLIRSTGRGGPERISASELGYLGEFRSLGLSVDLRVFEERVRDLLRHARPCASCPIDIVNKDPNSQRGWETQLRWQPAAGTQFLANYTTLRLLPDTVSDTPYDKGRAPRHIATLAWFQRLPADFELSLIHHAVGSFFYVRQNDVIPAYRQTDLRLGRRFNLGTTRAEAAVFIRAIDGDHADFVQRGYPASVLDRRAVASLRLEF